MRITLLSKIQRRSTSGSLQFIGEITVSCLWIMDLDSIKIQCTVITKAILPLCAPNVNIPIEAYRLSNCHFIKEQLRNMGDSNIHCQYGVSTGVHLQLKLYGSDRIEFLYQQAGNANLRPEI
ncbi:hypothetical protein Tco_0521718 [Tanacetum coccineum]